MDIKDDSTCASRPVCGVWQGLHRGSKGLRVWAGQLRWAGIMSSCPVPPVEHSATDGIIHQYAPDILHPHAPDEDVAVLCLGMPCNNELKHAPNLQLPMRAADFSTSQAKKHRSHNAARASTKQARTRLLRNHTALLLEGPSTRHNPPKPHPSHTKENKE